MSEDQIEPGYNHPKLTTDEYRQKYNSLPAVKESNLLLVNRSINSIKNVLLVLSIISVLFFVSFMFMGYSGLFKPSMNVTCEKTVCPKIPSYSCPSFTCPEFVCTIYQNGTVPLSYSFDNNTNLLFDGILYYRNQNIIEYNFSYDPSGNLLYRDKIYYLNQTINNCVIEDDY